MDKLPDQRQYKDGPLMVKVKFAMLEEHMKRPGEYGYNNVVTQAFESAGDFFEAWGDSLPSGLPTATEDPGDYKIHKMFGTLYVDDEGIPVACVSIEESEESAGEGGGDDDW